MLKRLLRRFLWPVLRPLARRVKSDDPWDRTEQRVPSSSFGRGSLKDFPWYFEGESAVVVGSVDDVCAWLLDCAYLHDKETFNEEDFWQHPSTFERLRQGDCEDHAIWAWRKLVELGLDAELVSGMQRGMLDTPRAVARGHVWIRFRQNGSEYILETVAKSRERMIRPFDEAKGDYVPFTGVDGRFQTYTYSGILDAIK